MRLALAVGVLFLDSVTAGRQRKARDAIVVGGVFSPEECARIISGAALQPRQDAVLFDGKGGAVKNTFSRDGTVAWLPVRGGVGAEWGWVLDRVQKHLHAGEKEWGVRSQGLGTEGIQVARYGPGHHYDWHTDCSAPLGGQPPTGRVISVTVQLSEPDYDGGQMEIAGIGNVSSKQGSMVLFPSSHPHKVYPVLRGERHSIVAWFAGAWGDGEGQYWRRAAGAYKAMLRSTADAGRQLCEAHEWHAETLMSRSRSAEAVAALEAAIDCNPGYTVLQDRVLQNAAAGGGGVRFQQVLADATTRFRQAVAAQPGSEIAATNLERVLGTAATFALPVVPDTPPPPPLEAAGQAAEQTISSEAGFAAAQERMLKAMSDGEDGNDGELEDVLAHARSTGGLEDVDALQEQMLDDLLDEL